MMRIRKVTLLPVMRLVQDETRQIKLPVFEPNLPSETAARLSSVDDSTERAMSECKALTNAFKLLAEAVREDPTVIKPEEIREAAIETGIVAQLRRWTKWSARINPAT